MKGFIGHIPFQSGTEEAEAGTELVAGLKDLLEIVSVLEKEECVTSSQTAARKNEDKARAEALGNSSPGYFTPANKEPQRSGVVTKQSKIVNSQQISS